jgi:hypothetical protein
MPEVHPDMTEVQMPKPAQKREQAQHQPNTKTRQIDRFPIESDHRFDPPRLPCKLFAPFEPAPFDPLPFNPWPRALLFSPPGSGDTSSGIFRAGGVAPGSGRNSSSNRSLNDGVSKILSSNKRQRRESS